MGKRACKNWTFSFGQSGTLVFLSVLFLFGGIVGCFFSRFSIGVESESLVSYLADYMALVQKGEMRKDFWNTAWNEFRYVLFIALFGMTPFKRVGVPLVLFLRGFFLSFSVGCLVQTFGAGGICLGAFLFLLPAFFWGPVLFLAAYRVISLNVPFSGEGFWILVGLCGVLLAACISIEYWLVPVIFRAAVRVVL